MTPRGPRRERKVSVVFRHTENPQHCAGIQSLCLLPDSRQLYSTSRDAIVHRWGVDDIQPEHQASYQGHADWVNDCVVVNDLLLTCSNDAAVRVWKTDAEGKVPCMASLTCHSDYVNVIAAAPLRSQVATGGLRSEIFITDVITGATHQIYPKMRGHEAHANGGPSSPSHHQRHSSDVAMDGGGKLAAPKGSIYALCMTPSASMLAAGTTENLIRLMDPRTGDKITKLRGHTGNVRCLLISPDGKLLLSGSSDSTVKLWDVGMQRCLQTYSMHSDSVWALQSQTSDLSVVLSGGRDGCVYRTHMGSRTSELMLEEKGPVSCMAYDAPSGSLFVGTHSSSSIHRWKLPQDLPTPGSLDKSGPSRLSFSARPRNLYHSGSHAHRTNEVRTHEAVITAPCAVIEGHPGVVDHKVLTDKRNILTQDMDGNVHLWDVLQGRVVQSFGQVDIVAKEAELFDAHAQHAWFSSDHRLGQLCLTMEPMGCFLAEDYAQILGYQDAPEDSKINFGRYLIEGAFSHWRATIAQMQVLQRAGSSSDAHHNELIVYPQHHSQNEDGNTNGHRGSVDVDAGGSSPGGSPMMQEGEDETGDSVSQQGGQGLAPGSPTSPHDSAHPDTEHVWSRFFPGVVPAVISSDAKGMRWCRVLSAFTGIETEPEEVPGWVGEIVLRSATIVTKDSKCAFVLLPAEPSLPGLLQCKLNAPRILQVHKVVQYCRSKLADQGFHLQVHPVQLRPPPLSSTVPPELPSQPELEITCNGWAVPHDLSLAAVRKYIWRKGSEDLVFLYKIRDPLSPAPMLSITLNS